MPDYAACPECRAWYRTKRDGTLRKHSYPVYLWRGFTDPHPDGCPGSGKPGITHLGHAEPESAPEAPEKPQSEAIWLWVGRSDGGHRAMVTWRRHAFRDLNTPKRGRAHRAGASICGRVFLTRHRLGFTTDAGCQGERAPDCGHCRRILERG